ncbi:MAG TPA: DUF4147 domain-containing protein [Blastocatellia bacterium]|nr:DUF4147 domain-containing protein [Blastocatellia bacterium]
MGCKVADSQGMSEKDSTRAYRQELIAIRQATGIFLEVIRSVDIEEVIEQRVKIKNDLLQIDGETLELSHYKEIVLIGLGKASLRMGATVERLLGERITRGILVTNRAEEVRVKSEIIVARHPVPDGNSLIAGKKIIELVKSCDADTLILFLLSGGGSALVELPIADEVTLEDLQELNRVLVNCGATIREINTIRKHLSRIKGGRLGHLARRSKCVALYLSDVNPGDMLSIASNPLMPDTATLADFYAVIEKYHLMELLPASIRNLIHQGKVGRLPEDWNGEGPQALHVLLLDNADLVNRAARIAECRGFRVAINLNQIEGRYQQVADELIQSLLELKSRFPDEKVCVVSGGEVSCPVQGSGTGGRNQEFVLYCAKRLAEQNHALQAAVLACGSDGIDGNSDAAGAAAGAATVHIAQSKGFIAADYLKNNDSHAFFKQSGGLVVTGPTGNNVRDLRILLAL